MIKRSTVLRKEFLPAMLLSDVLRGLQGTGIIPDVSGPAPAAIDIAGITYNSAEVQPGWIFVAIPGRKADGHLFITDAVERGAVAVAGARPAEDFALPAAVAYLRVPDPRRAMGFLACELAGQPSRRMAVVGVTGTDGKTTTTNLIAAILDVAGHHSGLTS